MPKVLLLRQKDPTEKVTSYVPSVSHVAIICFEVHIKASIVSEVYLPLASPPFFSVFLLAECLLYESAATFHHALKQTNKQNSVFVY